MPPRRSLGVGGSLSLPAMVGIPAAPLKLARCPHSLAAPPRSFTFYVADPISSIRRVRSLRRHGLAVARRTSLRPRHL